MAALGTAPQGKGSVEEIAVSVDSGSPTSMNQGLTPFPTTSSAALLDVDKHTFSAKAHSLGSDSSRRSNPPPTEAHNDIALTFTRKLKGLAIRYLETAPVLGLAALVLALMGIAASVAILLVSDKQPIDMWTFQPSVYLAIITALSNKAMAYAAFNGLIVTWWRTARRGTTMARLHHDWRAGLSIFGALGSGWRLTLPSLTCLLVSLTIIDGPLLQRSSSVSQLALNTSIILNVALTEELPANSTGQCTPSLGDLFARSRLQPILSANFVPVYVAYAQQQPIRDAVTGCPGRCELSVRAPYLATMGCNSTVYSLDYSAPMTAAELSIYQDIDGPPAYVMLTQGGVGRDVFSIYMGTTSQGPEVLVTRIGIATNQKTNFTANDNTANYTVTECTHVSAIAEYPIIVDKGVVSFATPLTDLTVVAIANNTQLSSWEPQSNSVVSFNTTLSGIASAGQSSFGLDFATTPLPANESADGVRSKKDAVNPVPFLFGSMLDFTSYESGAKTLPGFKDPTPDIMAGLNEMQVMMFRGGVWAAASMNASNLAQLMDPGLNTHYTIQGVRVDKQNVFVSTYGYFAGAAATNIVAIVVVLYTYRGWWNMRKVSFSPLELANAFEAPLLKNVRCDATAAEITRLVGNIQVEYGEVVGPSDAGSEKHKDGEARLAFRPAEPRGEP